MASPQADTLTVALTGDSLIARAPRDTAEAAWRRLQSFLGAADAAFTNLEVPLNDGAGYPTCRDTGTWCSADATVLAALQTMGFNLFACANNHSLDWADAGLLRTREILSQAGVTWAGIGATLSEARRPAYRHTPQGTIALLSMSTTFPEAWRAGDPKDRVPGRPGINALGHNVSYRVPHRLWEAVAHLNELLRLDAYQRKRVSIGFAAPDPEGVLRLFNHRFAAGKEAEVVAELSRDDAEANLAAVREARLHARCVVVSIHSHEMGMGGDEDPAAFLPPFARQCIDAGADIVVCHGPHLLRGLEMYRDRLICYSLGNFFFENELMQDQPLEYYQKYGLDEGATAEALFDRRSAGGGFAADRRYWQSVAVSCTLDDAGVTAVRLLPVTLGFGLGRQERGAPVAASGEEATGILRHLEGLSRPYGTVIRIGQDGSGQVEWRSTRQPEMRS